MNTARLKFVFYFLLFAFAFLIVSTEVLDLPPDSFFGSASQSTWKSIITAILSPIKIVVIGPLLPFIEFMYQDPDTPPPFFLIGFTLHWTVMAVIFHYLLGKLSGLKRINSIR